MVSADATEPGPAAFDAPVAAALAGEIRRLRKLAGLSQAGLAARTGFSRQYVSRAERPTAGLASANLVARMDAVLRAGGALTTFHERALAEQLARRAASAPGTGPAAAGLAADGAATGWPAAVAIESGDARQVTRSSADVLVEADQWGHPVDELPGPGSLAVIDMTTSDVMAFNAEVQRRTFLPAPRPLRDRCSKSSARPPRRTTCDPTKLRPLVSPGAGQ